MGICCPVPIGYMLRVATVGEPPVIAFVLTTMSVYWWPDDITGSCFRPMVALSLDTHSSGLLHLKRICV